MSITIPTQQDTGTPAPEKKAWVGAGWGAFLGGLAGNIATVVTKSPVAGVIAFGAGTIGGYFVGKSNGEKIAEEERRTGKKQVDEPHFWNYKLAKGYTIGELGATGAGLLLSAGSGVGTGAQMLLGLLPIGGLIYGGVSGKNEMRQEYDRAREIEASEQQKAILAAVGKARLPQEPGMTVTAADMAKIETAQQAGAANFTQSEDARRTAMPEQQNKLA